MLSIISASLISCKKDFSYENVTPEAEQVDTSTSNLKDSTTISALSTTYVRKNLIFDFTNEPSNSLSTFTANSLNFWAYRWGYSSTSIYRTNAYSRAGGYSTRYQLNKTDGIVGNSKRAENGRYVYSEPNPKVERWYGISYYLPSDYVYDYAPEILTQWHSPSVSGSPLLAMWTASGQWKLIQMGSTAIVLGNYERSKWTDFVFHVKWSSTSDGLLEVWKNGVKVATKYGKNMYSGVTVGAYMRTGIYKWPWYTGRPASSTTKRVAYIDEVRIGNSLATYKDVAPGN